MTRILVLGILALGTACAVFGQDIPTVGTAPEIDPSQAVTALALLSGGALVIRGRKKA